MTPSKGTLPVVWSPLTRPILEYQYPLGTKPALPDLWRKFVVQPQQGLIIGMLSKRSVSQQQRNLRIAEKAVLHKVKCSVRRHERLEIVGRREDISDPVTQ